MLLEMGLRGAAAALLTLLAISAMPTGLRTSVGRATLLFDLCALAFLIETAPGVHDRLAWWVVPFRLLSNATPGVFIVWSDVTFSDARRPLPWRWAPVGGMLILASVATLSDRILAWQVTHAAALSLVTIGTLRVVAGRRADLVESRRRARIVFACCVALGIAAATALDAARFAMLPALSAVLALALAAALMRLRPVVPDPSAAAEPLPAMPSVLDPAADITAEDRSLDRRLRSTMAEDRAYRDAGLTVRALAERLDVPEYRLRQWINGRLGHRNFTDFLNRYRLAEARAALADPAQARVPILTIALDAGWGSIGPFNRAFKASTGRTPTEFRRDALGGAGHLADSENGQVSPKPARARALSGENPPAAPPQPPGVTRRMT